MIKTETLKDYVLLDAGDREKLERWKDIILVRPDPMAIWPKTRPELWSKADAVYHRSNSGGGSWEFKKPLKEAWRIAYKDLFFKVAPTGFKHTGIFPEQAANWDFIYEKIQGKKDLKILNLFGYTGCATTVAAKAGAAEVVHVDASKSINEWAKENRDINKLTDAKIRYIVDDALKFIQREIRRGHHYDGIIMDPPSYGRGPDNELFKFEDKINPLIENCLELLSENALFFIINTYTTGYSKTALANTLRRHVEQKGLGGTIISDEIGIAIKDSDYTLPCGNTTRWSACE